MKKIIVANWKMNPTTLREAQKMFLGLKTGIKNFKAEVVVCPPFTYLQEGAKILKNKSNIKLGAQNCFWEEKSAFTPAPNGGEMLNASKAKPAPVMVRGCTGEISPKMLKDLGVKYVILGHSERIMTMAETNEMTAKKVKAVLKFGLTPIVCIGETMEEREQGKTFQVIEKEFRESLQGIAKPQVCRIIIAYEPLWAISTNQGKNCSSDDALTVALYIKKLAGEIFGKKAIEEIRVLYGGSVNVKNAKSYLENEAVSGLLVGGVSLNIKEFLGILKDI